MKQTFKIGRAPLETEKVAPQLKVILDAVRSAPNGEIDRDELQTRLEKDNSLKTKQSVARVVGYYLPRVKKDGLMSVVDHPEPKPVKVEKKADAPAAGAAGAAAPAAGAAAPKAATAATTQTKK